MKGVSKGGLSAQTLISPSHQSLHPQPLRKSKTNYSKPTSNLLRSLSAGAILSPFLISLRLQFTMQSSLSLSFSSSTAISRSGHSIELYCAATPLNLRFCGLRREALGFSSLKRNDYRRVVLSSRGRSNKVSASVSENGSAPKSFDYDLVIIGAGVGGHGAALHAVEKVRPISVLFYFCNYIDAVNFGLAEIRYGGQVKRVCFSLIQSSISPKLSKTTSMRREF